MIDKSVLVVIISDKKTAESASLSDLFHKQTYRNLLVRTIGPNVLLADVKKLISEDSSDYIFFIRESDSLNRDYFRKLLFSGEDADIIIGEYLENGNEASVFPNRTFNQTEIWLKDTEIKEYIDSQFELDFLWRTVWGKLYKTSLIKEAVSGISSDEAEFNAEFLKTKVYSLAKSVVSYKNSIYTYKSLPTSEKDYFTDRYVKIESPFFYDNIKELIADDGIKTVSFDIFDTLILRPFLYPTDLFIVLEQYADTLVKTVDGIGFKELRIIAEKDIRNKRNRENISEVTLDEIYEELELITSLDKAILESIKLKEAELELLYCYERKSGKELYELARYLGKQIVFTSDMYLPKETVEKILKKNGYSEGKLFLSSEYKKTKATKDLFTEVINSLKVLPSQILHIGDNYVTDVENAKELGFEAYHLPKAEELFNNWNPHIYSGSFFSNIFETRSGIVENYDAKEFLGIRCLMAISANKMFDNPFVIYSRESDFNGNPYTIGYFALGMHIYAICRWLIEEIQKNKYRNIHFMARDAYVVKKAFDELRSVFDVDVNGYYTYMSRKSLVPLMLQSEEDFINLVNCFNGYNIKPQSIFKVIAPVIKDVSEKELAELCKEIGIDFKHKIGSRENFIKLSTTVGHKLYDKEKAKEFKEKFSEAFGPRFEGKSATFDMGYSARVESVLKSSFGFDLTANYIHTTLDKANQRSIKNNLDVNCFYDFAPFISGIARELIMSGMSGSCIGYEFEQGKVRPLLSQPDIDSGTYYAIYNMHKGALDFVKDMVKIFGEYNKNLKIRKYYASMPFEYYLLHSKPFDRSIFSMTKFEDDMGLGNNISFDVFWNKMITRIPDYGHSKIYYNRYGKVRRYLIMILCGDLGELKHRVGEKLRRNKLAYDFVGSCYKLVRSAYRKVLRK